MAKLKVSMTIDERVYEQFRHYCSENGMKMSTKVEQMMKELNKNSHLGKYY